MKLVKFTFQTSAHLKLPAEKRENYYPRHFTQDLNYKYKETLDINNSLCFFNELIIYALAQNVERSYVDTTHSWADPGMAVKKLLMRTIDGGKLPLLGTIHTKMRIAATAIKHSSPLFEMK